MTPAHALLYALLGFAVGVFGTLIGAGGGFVLLPVLLFLHPHEAAASLTPISLAIVCVNATSGSIAYSRLKRVDFRSALLFAAAGLPGALLGAWVTRFVDRRVFDPMLGVMLILGAAAVLSRSAIPRAADPARATRRLVERDGTVHAYSPRLGLGVLISTGVGFVSSLLGIGGGIVHVPAMVYLLGFPTHIATATSHAVLAVLTLAALCVHAAEGTLWPALPRILPIAAGTLLGAPLGARLSSRVHDRWILRGLAVALAAVGVRLLFVR